MMMLLLFCLLPVAVVFGAILGWLLTLRSLASLYPRLTDPSIREMSFTTTDGVHWSYFGDPLPASEFTDVLQDAFEDTQIGALPGSRIR